MASSLKAIGAGSFVSLLPCFRNWTDPLTHVYIDMNLPLTGIAMTLVAFFLHLKTPEDDLKTKLKRMDWM